MEVRYFECFAGYGGGSFAFQKTKIPHKCVGYSEIDKFAIQCYEENHPNIKNYGDMTKIDEKSLPDFDLLTGGFPCQAFSLAGNRKGFEDMRGTLVYDLLRIAKHKKPKYLLFENVRGLNSHDEGRTVNVIVEEIEALGYSIVGKTYDRDKKCWQLPVLNSKDYGIPQNRERVWIIAKLGKWDFMEFMFPEKEELKIFVKDILEPEVDKKYILSDKMVKTILSRNRKSGFDISPSLCANMSKGNESTPIFPLNQRVNPEIAHTLTAGANSTGLHSDMDIFTIHSTQPRSGDPKKGGTGHLCRSDGLTYCLDTVNSQAIEVKNQFRRLTPRECFRLMGFLEDEIKFGNLSNAQLYKLAGNGWDVNIVAKILLNLFKKYVNLGI